MFQLIHLRFTQPRVDPMAFASVSSQVRGLLANRAASPDVVFHQTLDAALSGNIPRRQPETPATVDQWDLAKSLAFYKSRFADASHFTFVFVGSFTPEMHQPFVETYIASLPATHRGDLAGPRRRLADGRRREDDQSGIAPEEPGGDRLPRPVRVRRCPSAGSRGR